MPLQNWDKFQWPSNNMPKNIQTRNMLVKVGLNIQEIITLASSRRPKAFKRLPKSLRTQYKSYNEKFKNLKI